MIVETFRRLKLTVQYDGTKYSGWQETSINVKSIEAEINKAIYMLTSKESEVICAGRTDAGVHAIAQVCHFDTTSSLALQNIHKGLNYYLPYDIRIKHVQEVDHNFHARFSTIERSYKYLVSQDTTSNPLLKNRCLNLYTPINPEYLTAIITFLSNPNQDLIFFVPRNKKMLMPPYRNIKLIQIQEIEIFSVKVYEIIFTSKSFFHHQIRNMMGSIINVATGKWSMEEFVSRFNTQDRKSAGDMAPAYALYFLAAKYPTIYQ